MTNTPKRKGQSVAKSVTINDTPAMSTPASSRPSRSRNSPAGHVDFSASTYGKRVFPPPAKPSKATPIPEEEEDSDSSEDEDEDDDDSPIATDADELRRYLSEAKEILSVLEKKKSAEQARKLVVILTNAVTALENCTHSQIIAPPASSTSSTSSTSSDTVPPGWSMYDFLTAEGKKEVESLNDTHFATKDDRSVTMHFNGSYKDRGDSRYVCIACFEGGYLPESCIFKNLLGFQLHRKKGTGKKKVCDPCLAPAKVLEYKKTEMINGGVTTQAVIDRTILPATCVKITVPVNNELDEYCNIFFEASKIHPEPVVQKYKDEVVKFNAETKGMSKKDKAAAKKVMIKKPACSQWRMQGLTPTIQNMVDFNIYQFIRECIAEKKAFVAAAAEAAQAAPA